MGTIGLPTLLDVAAFCLVAKELGCRTGQRWFQPTVAKASAELNIVCQLCVETFMASKDLSLLATEILFSLCSQPPLHRSFCVAL